MSINCTSVDIMCPANITKNLIAVPSTPVRYPDYVVRNNSKIVENTLYLSWNHT